MHDDCLDLMEDFPLGSPPEKPLSRAILPAQEAEEFRKTHEDWWTHTEYFADCTNIKTQPIPIIYGKHVSALEIDARAAFDKSSYVRPKRLARYTPQLQTQLYDVSVRFAVAIETPRFYMSKRGAFNIVRESIALAHWHADMSLESIIFRSISDAWYNERSFIFTTKYLRTFLHTSIWRPLEYSPLSISYVGTTTS
ncbi:hypothetical protein HBH74_228230 [Parastagonospora nodorum]|nr:hypothetical protein HBH74_228230 [Parastagonospora nodorum]